jgi:superfamily I DNA and/or RNA helicase
MTHTLLHNKTFDYVFIDEASQINLAHCLAPISLAKVFVLVGDTYQVKIIETFFLHE